MASTEVTICNVALARIGERQLMTGGTGGVIDTSVDDSAAAALCAALYPVARDTLIELFPWSFSTRQLQLNAIDFTSGQAWSSGSTYAKNDRVVLNGTQYFSRVDGNSNHQPVVGGEGDIYWAPGYGPQIVPGWAYTYKCPADFARARYLFAGARPGQPVAPSIDSRLLALVGQIPVSAGGPLPQVPFEVNKYTDGTWYLGSDWLDPVLVYTPALTDAASFPALFADALSWRVAADLALSQATKGGLAQGMASAAEAALAKAKAADLAGRQFDPAPTSRFITARG